jgi:hypothetical protein
LTLNPKSTIAFPVEDHYSKGHFHKSLHPNSLNPKLKWMKNVVGVRRAYDYNPDKGGEASQQEAPGVQASTTNAPKVARHVRQLTLSPG